MLTLCFRISFTTTLIRELHLLLLLYCRILISFLHQWQLLLAQRKLQIARRSIKHFHPWISMWHHHAIVSITRIVFVSPVFTLTEIQKTRMEKKGLLIHWGTYSLTQRTKRMNLTVIPAVQSQSMTLIPVIAPRSRSSWNISLSLGETGRNDIRKVLTSVMNWELKRKRYQSELNMTLRTLQIVMH